MGDENRISSADIEAQAAQMMPEPWSGLVEYELALPPCPVCGDRQALLVDGSVVVCESQDHSAG
jgi:hypothetical protein